MLFTVNNIVMAMALIHMAQKQIPYIRCNTGIRDAIVTELSLMTGKAMLPLFYLRHVS
jgi:hypothetical protein